MNYTYKSITKKDTDFLIEIFSDPEYETIFYEGNTNRQDWIERFEQIKSFRLVYENNAPIGIIDLINKDNYVELGLIVIKRDLHNKKYGFQIMKDIVSELQSNSLRLSVQNDNKKAVNFYLLFGFAIIGEENQYVLNGNQKKYYVMEYKIKK